MGAIAARLHKRRNHRRKRGIGAEPDKSTRRLQDTLGAQGLYLADELRWSPPELGREDLGIERLVRMPMEEHDDIPREQRPHVVLHEPYDLVFEGPFAVTHNASDLVAALT